MPLRNFLAFVFILCANMAWADAPPVPDTPAGKTLSAWLDAFNSGDRARVETFLKTHSSKLNPDHQMFFREQTGGFDLLVIEKSEKTQIVFRVKEKGSPTQALGKLDVTDADPPAVLHLSLHAMQPDAKFVEVKLDAAERARVIDGVDRMLDEFYVFPDIAKKMSAAVRARQKHGEYDAISDGDAFAEKLTEDLREISHDRHLDVGFDLQAQPEHKDGPAADHAARDRKRMAASNCGFEKAEHISGNIGYLKFDMFADPELCGPTAIAAMNFLGDSDAIIFDLRENGGGAPAMIALISTYLFDQPTHLNDIYNRKQNTTSQFWTLPFVPGKKLADKPVFVLTSKFTFSGAEEFSYNLKNLKRATLIGETTGGGAHPVGEHRIDEHFSINVPFARAISPITKTNWEGTGVEPDIKMPAADALNEALKLAREKMRSGDAKP